MPQNVRHASVSLVVASVLCLSALSRAATTATLSGGKDAPVIALENDFVRLVI